MVCEGGGSCLHELKPCVDRVHVCPPQVRHQLSLYLHDLKRAVFKKRVLNLPVYCSWLPLACVLCPRRRCPPADAPALERDLFCAVESVDAGCQEGGDCSWLHLDNDRSFSLCACGFEIRRAKENPTVTLQEGCPRCLWWCSL